jgi:hypothetical protein
MLRERVDDAFQLDLDVQSRRTHPVILPWTRRTSRDPRRLCAFDRPVSAALAEAQRQAKV